MMSSDNNTQVRSETLETGGGVSVTIIHIGATIGSLLVPSANELINAVLSYSDQRKYLTDSFYLGSTVGPVANRIRSAQFKLDGTLYRLDANDADRGNCLHGGSDGLHRQHFSLERDEKKPLVRCRADLSHGLGGFPGNRSFEVIYEMLNDWSLAIDFRVTTDRDTVVNLANHAYFNLGGSVDDHRLRVSADAYTPVDELKIPTGEFRDVGGSGFDLRNWQPLGDRAFDHNFVLRHSDSEPKLAAQLQSLSTGLQLSVLTTQPGIQVYTGDYLSDPFRPRQGICFEAQGFPDAPNRPDFPSIRLEAGATYRQRTVYQFSYVDGFS